MFAAPARQRLVAGAPATLAVILTDETGEPADATTVTVEVVRADGTVLRAAGTATTEDTTIVGRYTVSLTAAETATLDVLEARWTESGVRRATTFHETVGGVYWSIAALRASDRTLTDTEKYSDDRAATVRSEVETECEEITGVAWVPRYRWALLTGTGTTRLVLPDVMPRTVRAARLWAPGAAASSYTALSAGDIAAIQVNRTGTIVRTDGVCWPSGHRIAVGYEHGYDTPPADLIDATLLRARWRLNSRLTAGIPQQSQTFLQADGVTVGLARPGAKRTGIDEIDAVYMRYDHSTVGIA